jgi:hypothetical protein
MAKRKTKKKMDAAERYAAAFGAWKRYKHPAAHRLRRFREVMNGVDDSLLKKLAGPEKRKTPRLDEALKYLAPTRGKRMHA